MTGAFLFGVLPYLAVVLAVAGTVFRFRRLGDTVTARSSQLLEGRWLFWGSVPWHHAILPILAAHLLATVAPGAWARLLGAPVRLYVLEVTGLGLGALTVLGIAVLLVRRLAVLRQARPLDVVVLASLALQAATGVWIAFSYRWGSGWYLFTARPWLASLASLDPRIAPMVVLPIAVQVHALNAFVLLALTPFTRLVHAVVFPVHYLWRRPQRVVWRRAPGRGEEVIP
jgi:nitrate reductase gamma subunit